MSASIYWEPAERNKESLYTLAPSTFLHTLQAIGLDVNTSAGAVVDESYLTPLRGMASVFRETDDGKRNPYQQLIDAIEKHGSIRVWAVY